MCDIKNICNELNGESCLVDLKDKLINKIDRHYSNKKDAYNWVHNELLSALTAAVDDHLKQEIDDIKETLNKSQDNSFDLVDLGLTILLLLPGGLLPSFILKIFKVSFNKVIISSKLIKSIKGGLGKSKLNKLIKKADDKFMTLALYLDYPELYDETFKFIGEQVDKKKNDIEKEVKNYLTKQPENSEVENEVSSIILQGITISDEAKEFKNFINDYFDSVHFNINANEEIEKNSITTLYSQYLLSETTELICLFDKELENYAIVLNKEVKDFYKTISLLQFIVNSYPKNFFINEHKATKNVQNYKDYTDIMNDKDSYHSGYYLAKDNTAQNGNTHPPYDVYSKGEIEIKSNETQPEIFSKHPIANQLLKTLRTRLMGINLLKSYNNDLGAFLIDYYSKYEEQMNGININNSKK